MTTEEYADPNTKEPGLHRIGPAPYDYVFNPAKGQRVDFLDKDGVLHKGVLEEFFENDETGEMSLTINPFPTLPLYKWVTDVPG